MLTLHLYILQRATALVMAPLVFAHIVVMIVAVQDGLTAAEILGRTQGSLGWGLFYGLFVLAASIHAAIGLRVVSAEWLGLRGAALKALTFGAFGLLLVLGMRAVVAVTVP